MVLGYHIILTAYGFWLPNDPRGSWSDFVGSWELFRYGPATKVTTTRSVASKPHDHRQRLAAKSALKYPPVTFTGQQALAISRGFAAACRAHDITIWACAILPEHVHLVVRRHETAAEGISKSLKIESTRALRREKLHPFESHVDEDQQVPAMWAKGRWKVFLNSPEDVRRSIQYVENNPLKEGKRLQRWSFVRAFD